MSQVDVYKIKKNALTRDLSGHAHSVQLVGCVSMFPPLTHLCHLDSSTFESISSLMGV